jgi:NAD(P)-dependent dehydrogenase (short-subunit alcohol dehydrogenase family)
MLPDSSASPEESMGRLEEKVAFVTGAASGIGLACAQRFAAEGAAVAGLDLAEPSDWTAVAEAAPAVSFHVADVRDEEAQRAAVAAALETHGHIDILVTAAGVAGGGPVHLIAAEEWQRVQDVNLKGTFLSARAVLPSMIERRAGNIITVASVEGLEGFEGGTTYNASKGGVVQLTRCMAMDYGRVGIRVNCICPGFIETPLFHSVIGSEGFPEKYRERIREQHKLGRFGRAEEIAGAAFFLASDDASFVTGVALPVDGGFTAGHSVGVIEMMGLDGS